MMNKFLMNI